MVEMGKGRDVGKKREWTAYVRSRQYFICVTVSTRIRLVLLLFFECIRSYYAYLVGGED
jgi:hypothetical protein